MSFLLPLVAGWALLPGAEPEKPVPLHYVRPRGWASTLPPPT